MRAIHFILSSFLVLMAAAATAQSSFNGVITVNDTVITRYELDQRIQMLRVFRTPGDLNEVARKQLIEERLMDEAMTRAGVALTEEGMAVAMSDFAGRANLDTEQFVALLAQNGVDRPTVEQFVRVGLTWRDYIRSRYGSQARITDAEVDRALSNSGTGIDGIEVLLSEIIIPAPPPRAAAAQAQAQRISQLTSTSAFEAQARRVSALPSRANGGRLGWLPIANYPSQLRSLLLSLKPGEVTAPINIPNGVALFQMRAVRETDTAPAVPTALEYAALHLAPDADVQTVIDRVDTCDDLYGEAKGLPEDVLERITAAPEDLAQDVALELARLDPNETSANLRQPVTGAQTLLMLCNRQYTSGEAPDRETLRNRLRSERLAGLANALLADLRAAATIIQ